MIREQIARKLAESDDKDWNKMRNKDTWTCIEDYMSGKETYYEYADQILSLLCAEIEKMGLSDEEQITLDNRFRVETDHRLIIRQVAQAQLQKILNKLKEGAE